MTASPEPIVVKVDELNALVDSVPYLLGFTPRDSVVVVSLREPRQRMEFTVRLDLLPEDYDDKVARMFAERMRAAEADSVMVFVYTDAEPTERGLPRRALVDRIVDTMPIEVRDAWLVTDERVWAYLCDEEECCPSQGWLREQTAASLALSAAHALRGDVVLPDRETLVATVQPVSGERAIEMERAIDTAAAAYGALDPRRAQTKARRLATKLRARYECPPATLTDDEAAALIVAMHDWPVRDKMIDSASTESDAMRTLLHDLAVRAVPPLDAPACTAYAWVSYIHGNGLVAMTALERALKSDPEYSLALLLEEALMRQVPPSRLRQASVFG
jgi:hypothetical protein